MKPKKLVFDLYRYQILPTERDAQKDFFNELPSSDELLAQKNQIFADKLRATDHFEFKKTITHTKLVFEREDLFVFRIAANRSIHREKLDFTEEQIDNWPSIYVVIWNNPKKQFIAVQHRTTAFQLNTSVAKNIVKTINDKLSDIPLTVKFEALFESNEFWKLVQTNEGKILSVDFEFLTPNMANISGSLDAELKQLVKTTNSIKNNLKLQSDEDTSLNLQVGNETIDGLVQYSGDGGGNISMKIRGLKKKVKTSKTVRNVEVDGIDFEGDPETAATILKQILP